MPDGILSAYDTPASPLCDRKKAAEISGFFS
jgi:hypothetical protein